MINKVVEIKRKCILNFYLRRVKKMLVVGF